MYDLAISPHGDLIFAANRDLLGAAENMVVEQRIRLRLRMQRGTWVYDEDNRLGSQLHLALGRERQRAIDEIPIFVREALRNMEDIEVTDVQVGTENGTTISVLIGFINVITENDATAREDVEGEENTITVALERG